MYRDEMPQDTQAGDLIRGAVAGMVAGAVAALVMNQFQNLLSTLTPGDEGEQLSEGEGGPKPEQKASNEDEPATTKAAEAISQRLLHHDLSREEKKVAGPVMHYGFGATMGGLYGVAAEAAPAVRTGGGTAYGAAVWLAADEVAVPALGLGPPPTQTQMSTHMFALASHLVYGLTLEMVRRRVLAMMKRDWRS